jgi:uncharacterized protein (DUF2141 family)
MKKNLIAFAFLVFSLLSGGTLVLSEPPNENKGILTVVITGFRNQNGNVGVALFRSREGFPDEPEKAFKRTGQTVSENIKEGKVTISFSDIPFGSYAVLALHDENANKKMDKNLIGIPKEGFCFSRDAKGFLGPPKFEDAVVALTADQMVVECRLSY